MKKKPRKRFQTYPLLAEYPRMEFEVTDHTDLPEEMSINYIDILIDEIFEKHPDRIDVKGFFKKGSFDTFPSNEWDDEKVFGEILNHVIRKNGYNGPDVPVHYFKGVGRALYESMNKNIKYEIRENKILFGL